MDNSEIKKYLLDFAKHAEPYEINGDMMDIPSGTAEKIKQLVKDFDCMIYERDEYKELYYNYKADATNLTGELVTVSAENEDLKQEVKYLHDVIADYDDCCKKRACPNMEKLKEQNEALKRVLKSKIRVHAYPVCAEEHDGCLGCNYQIESEPGFPCKKCKGAVSPLSEEYKTRKDFWSDKYD